MGKIFFSVFLAALIVLSFPRFSSAEEVSVTSNFDKRSAQVGEEIHLTIRISGANGNIQAPRLPSFQGFDTFYTGRASHITFINGESSSNIEFSYSLIPKEPGRHSLAPIEVQVNGQRFATESVDLEVTPGAGGSRNSYTSQNAPFNPNALSGGSGGGVGPAAAPPPQSAQGPQPAFVPNDDNIFVRAWVDKNVVYPNEQILLSYSLYTRYDTRYEGFDKEPQVSGFWIEDFPMDKDIRRETVHVEGKRYMKADIKMMALFPTSPADYTIDPGVLKASIRQDPQNNSVFDEFFNDSFFSGGGFFARRESRLLKPAPIQVTVKPFPEEGKPASFQGAVGNYKLTATLDKETVKQNEPVTMKLAIEGEGNIETLNKPKTPEDKDLKIYDSDSSSQMFKTGNVIGGRKTFEIVIIPTKSGKVKIPQLEFSYFNPLTAKYVTQKSPAFEVTVTPSDQPIQLPKGLEDDLSLKKDIEVQGKDIRYIWEKAPEDNTAFSRPFYFLGLAGGNILMIFAVLFGLLRRRQEEVYSKDSALKRRKFARATAERNMGRLKRLKGKREEAYFDEAEKILTQYLSDKLNLSAYGMTRYDLEFQLRETLGPEDPLFQDIRNFYEACESSRFGKGEIPGELKNKVLHILKETIARVEKMKR